MPVRGIFCTVYKNLTELLGWAIFFLFISECINLNSIGGQDLQEKEPIHG